MSGILGQSAPLAVTWTDIYTCPADTVSALRVIVSNRGSGAASFRVAASKGGNPIANEHWLAPDKAILGNDTGSSIAFIVSATDVVRVYASDANLSFTATGETRST